MPRKKKRGPGRPRKKRNLVMEWRPREVEVKVVPDKGDAPSSVWWHELRKTNERITENLRTLKEHKDIDFDQQKTIYELTEEFRKFRTETATFLLSMAANVQVLLGDHIKEIKAKLEKLDGKA